MKITNRDIRVFVLGMITLLAIASIYNWKESKDAFMRGWNDVPNSTVTKNNAI